MNTRLILWTLAMASVLVLVVGKGSFLPLSVTITSAVIGAGFGVMLAIVFSRRAKRKFRPATGLRRY
jgi:membrane associated rhomboid family serine protease